LRGLRLAVASARRLAMATKTTIDTALDQLETLSDEIRVKLHLAGMDAKKTWNEDLEPKLEDARLHARDAKTASKKVIDDTIAAFKAFAAQL
jgi:hypothetical protein